LVNFIYPIFHIYNILSNKIQKKILPPAKGRKQRGGIGGK